MNLAGEGRPGDGPRAPDGPAAGGRRGSRTARRNPVPPAFARPVAHYGTAGVPNHHAAGRGLKGSRGRPWVTPEFRSQHRSVASSKDRLEESLDLGEGSGDDQGDSLPECRGQLQNWRVGPGSSGPAPGGTPCPEPRSPLQVNP